MKQLAPLALLLAPFVAVLGCSQPGTTGVDGPNGNPDDPGGNGSYDHTRAPGASAGDMLSADDFDRLVVQVQYVEGHPPSDEGLQHLQDFLSARLNKPAGIVIQAPEAIQVPSDAAYSDGEVRALEQQHRTAFTEDNTIAVYLLFLDGEYAEASNVLGIAYNNTSMAIFGETIAEHTGGPLEPSPSTVEGTVANHEFGHILGLVNNGSAMQTEHQDEAHGAHCDDERCLMYYAVRTTDFISNLLDGMPDLDANCMDDLQANGGR